MTENDVKITYNPLSGWVKVDGARVGNERKNGRVLRVPAGTFNGVPAFRMVPEHQWIWETKTVLAPVGDIVHLNGDKFDNRWKNLRDQNGLLVEASNDGIHGSSLQVTFAYSSLSGDLHDIMQGTNAVKMSDDRPVVFWAGQWLAAEDVAWFLETGVWPERGVVMVNGDYRDLRVANLRRCV